jgi:hypothetical protein
MIADRTFLLATGKIRAVLSLLICALILFAFACGGDEAPRRASIDYATSYKNIDDELKGDSRVESFETDGGTLVVNVNNWWVSSGHGLREQALGKWYKLWSSANNGGSVRVLVKHEGDDVASWTGDKGYQPVAKPKESDETADAS